ALAENWAVTGSLRWRPLPGTSLGASAWHGNTGQGQEFAGKQVDVPMTLAEVHAEWKRDNVWLRALYAQATIGDTTAVSNDLGEAIGERMTGWYAEAGYNIMPALGGPGDQALYPWVRYTALDTQASLASGVKDAGFSKDPANDRSAWVAGLQYHPHPQVALKAEYRDWSSKADSRSANNGEEYLVGVGYSF
ncbi:MAG TPA: hypothetical protein VKA48_07600, partial [Gammaproteobacteria bacterium]|nr:hypothetical protein [Gammaproteobacteria bacterium]